jgi:hypothetical protein
MFADAGNSVANPLNFRITSKKRTSMNEQKPKSGRGCLLWGGIAAGVLFLIILLAAVTLVRTVKKALNEYTDATPLTLPTAQATDEEVSRVRERISKFREAMQSGKTVEPLIVTTDEANALIAKDPELKGLQGHFYLTFDEGKVQAQMSLPADQLGIKLLKGRYLNGTGEFKVSLRDGTLWVSPESMATSKGKTFPENAMQGLRAANFAANYTNNPDFNAAMAKVEDIQVKPGKLIIIPKKPQ